MSKYLFKTKCPACGDREIFTWCHDPKNCGGARYIDEDLYLHCNKCNDKTFLFNSPFRHFNVVNMITMTLIVNMFSMLFLF